MEYRGYIIEESLRDPCFINRLKVLSVKITEEELPLTLSGGERGRWHIYKVIIREEQIKELQKLLLPDWYAHFWKDDELLVVFKGRMFTCSRFNKSTWKEAIEYGLSIGIPREELDFVTE
jgi:hypothetical protein